MNSTAKSIMIFPSESFSRTEDRTKDRTQDRLDPKDAQVDRSKSTRVFNLTIIQ